MVPGAIFRTGKRLNDDNGPTRRRILEAAVRLFTLHGYHATGIADIQKEAQVKRGSLYFHFASKEALAAEVLSAFFDSVGVALAQELSGPIPSPLDSLFSVFAAIRDQSIRDGFRGGCLLGNFASELAADSEPARLRIRGYFERLIAAVAVFLEKAQSAGEMRPDLDPRAAARLFVSSFHGALIELRVYRDATVYDEVMGALKTRLTGARAPEPEVTAAL